MRRRLSCCLLALAGAASGAPAPLSIDATPPTLRGPREWQTDVVSHCQLLAPALAPGETMRWLGGCANGRANGQGLLRFYALGQPTASFEGRFADGRLQGKGRYQSPDGSSYDGEFQDGRRHGKGVYVAPKGARYEGDFVEDRAEGQGRVEYLDKIRFDGRFEAGGPNGFGILIVIFRRRLHQFIWAWPTCVNRTHERVVSEVLCTRCRERQGVFRSRMHGATKQEPPQIGV